MKYVYVTGNEHKARLFSKMIGLNIDHVKVDLDEIQSLDLRQVIEHKAKAAYNILKNPVIVEDTKLVFPALGNLPGPLIKWFLDELGASGLCKLLDGYDDKSSVAGAAIAYYDGVNLEIFEKELSGKIANKPRGNSGFGWNVIFIPEGSNKTLGEMSEQEFESVYKQIKPFEQIRDFLDKL